MIPPPALLPHVRDLSPPLKRGPGGALKAIGIGGELTEPPPRRTPLAPTTTTSARPSGAALVGPPKQGHRRVTGRQQRQRARRAPNPTPRLPPPALSSRHSGTGPTGPPRPAAGVTAAVSLRPPLPRRLPQEQLAPFLEHKRMSMSVLLGVNPGRFALLRHVRPNRLEVHVRGLGRVCGRLIMARRVIEEPEPLYRIGKSNRCVRRRIFVLRARTFLTAAP